MPSYCFIAAFSFICKFLRTVHFLDGNSREKECIVFSRYTRLSIDTRIVAQRIANHRCTGESLQPYLFHGYVINKVGLISCKTEIFNYHDNSYQDKKELFRANAGSLVIG